MTSGYTVTHTVNRHVIPVLTGVEIEGMGKIKMRNLWLERLR
jgi:hypothetical protein